MNLFRCALLTITFVAFPAIAANAASTPAASPVVDPGIGSTLSALRAKAEQGDASALYDLGLAYIQGRQTARDPVEACVWLTLAVERGVSGDALGRVTAGLTSSQLAQAHRRLESLRAAHPNLRAPPFLRTGQDREAAPSPPASAPPSRVVDSSLDSTPALDAIRLQERLSAAEARLRESQEKLSKQSAELANLRADSALDRLELEIRKDQLAAAKKALSAGPADDLSATEAASFLERERAAHAATQAALAAAERNLADLAAARVALERELASRNGVDRGKAGESGEARTQTARVTDTSRKAADLEHARKDPGPTPQALGAVSNQATAAAEQQTRQVAVLEVKANPAREPAQPKAGLALVPGTATSAGTSVAAVAQAESKRKATRTEMVALTAKPQTAGAAAVGSAAGKSAVEILTAAFQELANTDREIVTLQQQTNGGQRFAVLRADLNAARFKLSSVIKNAADRASDVEGHWGALNTAATRANISTADVEIAGLEAAHALQQIVSATEELATMRTQAVAALNFEARPP